MARAKPKKAPRRPVAVKPAQKTARSGESAGTEVEKRWTEYWARRKQLEEAVDKVRAASAALKSAQELEKARRAEFDETKESLTTLLDVDPVGAAAREPIPFQRSLPETAPKQIV